MLGLHSFTSTSACPQIWRCLLGSKLEASSYQRTLTVKLSPYTQHATNQLDYFLLLLTPNLVSFRKALAKDALKSGSEFWPENGAMTPKMGPKRDPKDGTLY